MSEFVRVRLENGAEASIPAEHAEMAGLEPLSKDAYAGDGSVIPTKLRAFAQEAEGYAALKVDELKAEIDARNATRDEADHITSTGNKADLIAALESDDGA